ncbi:hypothetical protein M404DRAFT_751562 [Pisolithus tinctorius Marx 270]|uniref:Uncharacterized protein n=1 Tax=Pisolithus tinctorius Marx 270 TaxID=870435 RepID=A0A0C3JTF7_PISTI|nr:hypothetical protein M404DRAFT_751562 [Pisolithus tinctorius Marx 270]
MSSGNEAVAFEDGGDGYTLVGSLRRNLVVPPCTAWLRERLLREQSESEYNAMKGDLSISPSPQGWEECGARTRAGREANEADSRRPGNSSRYMRESEGEVAMVSAVPPGCETLEKKRMEEGVNMMINSRPKAVFLKKKERDKKTHTSKAKDDN